jgi:hypothetical protein
MAIGTSGIYLYPQELGNSFNSLIDRFSQVRNGEDLKNTQSLITGRNASNLNAQLVGILDALNVTQNSSETESSWYYVGIFPDEQDNRRMSVRLEYVENQEALSAEFGLYIDEQGSIVTSLSCNVLGQPIANLDITDDPEVSYTLSAPEDFNGEVDLPEFVGVISDNITRMQPNRTNLVAPLEQEPPFEIQKDFELNNLTPSEVLSKSIVDSLMAAGYDYYKAVEILLGRTDTDAETTLNELGISIKTEWKAEMRATFKANKLFGRLSSFLRNSQAALSNLVERVNPQWAELLMDIKIKDDDILYVVTLPDGDSATLSGRQVVILSQILEVQRFINPQGRKMLQRG